MPKKLSRTYVLVKRDGQIREELCETIDDMGYQHSFGVYAKEVRIDGQEVFVQSYNKGGPYCQAKPYGVFPAGTLRGQGNE